MAIEIKVVSKVGNKIELACGDLNMRVYRRMKGSESILAGGMIWNALTGKQVLKSKDPAAASLAEEGLKKAHEEFSKQ